MLEGKKLIQLVVSLERSFPIHTLNHQGVNWWPVLRTFAAMRLRAAPPNESRKERGQGTSMVQKFAPKFVKNWHNKLAWRQLRKAEGQQELPSSVDFITFGQPSQKNETLDGKKINRFVEPIHLLSEKKGLHIEAALSVDGVIKNGHSPTHFFGSRILEHRSAISSKKLNPLPEPFRDWVDQMRTQFSDEFFSLENIQYWIDLVTATKEAMLDVLQNCTTKKVVLAAFYDPLNFGVSWACSLKQVKVVEMQHGVQNDFHFGYAQWTNLSERAKPFMPAEFWNYSDQDANRISHQFPEGWMQAKVAGNLWLQWYQRSQVKKTRMGAFGLITLGMDHQFIPEFLIEFLDENIDTRWTLRLHPRAKMEAKDVAKLFKTRGIENCNIVASSEENLFAQIQRTFVHVTGMSSVAIEAAQMGVPTILFMKAGLEYYREYIEKGTMFDGVGIDKLKMAFEEVKSERSKKDPEDLPFVALDDLLDE